MVHSKATFFVILAFCNTVVLASNYSQLLNRGMDLSTLPLIEFDANFIQYSSYDRTGGNDDGFSTKYSSIRREKNRNVLAEVTGSGYICRIWTTFYQYGRSSIACGEKPRFRIDIDHKQIPSVFIPPMEMFMNKKIPFLAPLSNHHLGGFVSYVPIPFSEKCTVSIENGRFNFYQIGLKLFSKKTIQSQFSMKLTHDDRVATNKANRFLKFPKFYDTNVEKNCRNSTKKLTVHPGDKETLFESNTTGLIRYIKLNVTPASSIENLRINMYWDDSKKPAVSCPVNLFFISGKENTHISSLLIEFDGTHLISRIPMPFRQSARIEIQYKNSEASPNDSVKINSSIGYSSQKWVKGHGLFHIIWQPSKTLDQSEYHTACDIKGTGHLIGYHMRMKSENMSKPSYLEGDDILTVDGEMVAHGTGTEDFFNCGWYCLNQSGCSPFSGFTIFSSQKCAAYRWMVLDKIPFRKNLKLVFEHGSENSIPAEYESIAYFYLL